MNLLMISGDRSLIKGEQGPFYYLLKEFSKYWDRIDVLCPGASLESKIYFDKVHLHGVKSKVKEIVASAETIYQQEKFSVMTVHDYPPFKHSLAARAINQHLGVPYLLELHHIVGYPKAADFKEWLLKIYSELLLEWITRKAKAIRVVNQNQVPKFLKISGIAETKIKYLPSFYLDQQIFHPQNIEKKYDLLFVGRLAKNKGLDLLLEILSLLKKEMPDFKAVIVGEDSSRLRLLNYARGFGGQAKLKAQSSKLFLDNNINFLGWVADSQSLAKVYNQSKILLITSYNEGGPRVGFEAMACGVPVISTPVGIMIDIISDGQNGYLANWSAADFVDKIKKLLSDKNLYQNISQQATQAVKQFDYQLMIKNYAEGIKSLI